MTDTSYLSSYAPHAGWSVRQAPVPAAVHNLPSSIAGNSQAQSSLIVTEGFSLIAAGVTASQAGTLSIQRYLDAGGTVAQGPAVQVALAANTPANLDIMDGRLFAALKVTISNSSGSTSNLTNFALLLQASDENSADNAVDGSASITTGGTAQNLFGGTVPANGFAVYNPHPTEYVWISDTTTAAANAEGCIPIAPLGGYETPSGYRPLGPVSVIAVTTGHVITAKRW